MENEELTYSESLTRNYPSYCRNNYQKKSNNNSGFFGLPLLYLAFIGIYYYAFLLLIPFIPSMYIGYEFSKIITLESNSFSQHLLIIIFGIVGVITQHKIIISISNLFKKKILKYILYVMFYGMNIYCIYYLAAEFPNEELTKASTNLNSIKDFFTTIYAFIKKH